MILQLMVEGCGQHTTSLEGILDACDPGSAASTSSETPAICPPPSSWQPPLLHEKHSPCSGTCVCVVKEPIESFH